MDSREPDAGNCKSSWQHWQ